MYDDIIKEFWLCSLKQDFSEFDWDDAFNELRVPIEQKLAEHGLGDFDEFLEFQHDIGCYDLSQLESFTTCTDYIHLDENAIFEAIMRFKFEQFQDVFGGMFEDLEEMIEKIDKLNKLSEPEKILLFDSVIHAQHQSGDIFEDTDIESLRSDAESEWEELQEEKNKFPTNMREFL